MRGAVLHPVDRQRAMQPWALNEQPSGTRCSVPAKHIDVFATGEKAMIDHLILTVSDVQRSLTFYEAALAPLNISMFMPFKGNNGNPDLWGFGDGKRAFFWLKQGSPSPEAIHWGFEADNIQQVNTFYEAAMAAGAKDRISPRARLEFYPGYYAADVTDPDGYHFEVVHKA